MLETNTDPDPDPIRIQGFNDQKLKKNYSWKFYFYLLLSKTPIYLSLGLHKVCPSYRRSLQFSKESIQHFKTWTFTNYCLLLWVIFALLDPDPDFEYGSGSTDPIEYGSNPDPDPQPCVQQTPMGNTSPSYLGTANLMESTAPSYLGTADTTTASQFPLAMVQLTPQRR